MSFWSRIEKRLGDLAGEFLPDEFRDQLTGARDLFEQGRLEDAEGILRAILREREEDPDALTLLGRVQLEKGEYEQADRSFELVLKNRPDYAEALLGRGDSLLRRDHAVEAEHYFRKAVDQARGESVLLAAAYRGLGHCYETIGELDKAVREYRKAVAETPGDPEVRTRLGALLLRHPDVSTEEARRHLDRAANAEESPAVAWLALGELALQDGDTRGARERFSKGEERALASGDQELTLRAVVGLGDTALTEGDPAGAYQQFLRGLGIAGDRAELHARAADARRLTGDWQAALTSYRHSLELSVDRTVLEHALDCALELEDDDEIERLGASLLEVAPSSRRALIAVARGQLRRQEYSAASETLRQARLEGEDVEVHVTEALLALADSDPERAAQELLLALRIAPHHRRARELLGQARGLQLGIDTGASDPVGLAALLARTCLAHGALAQFAPAVQTAAGDFDEPLLLTVMGEFSSGKSSFVNAFIGEDVAPTGITPTTATINVLKYGRERGGRIRYADGTARELEWEELFRELHELGAEEVRSIEWVEILVPLAELQRVQIVDTPGLNSIIPEHEEVARQFIGRADAIVWLFASTQAGKKSEREALAEIQKAGKRTLGVLNKIDLVSAEERQQVVDHVTGELEGLVEAIVPFSATRVLGRAAEERHEDADFELLRRALEERFFRQARVIKLQVACRRLRELIADIEGAIDRQREQAERSDQLLRNAASRARESREEYVTRLVPEERRLLVEAAVGLYRRTARETLELVQPRRLPFGSHTATPADRDYLVSLLESGFEALLEPSRRRVLGALEQCAQSCAEELANIGELLGADAGAEMERTVRDASDLLSATIFDRCQAYLRGYVRGGYVDAFLRTDLPKIELSEDAIYHALYRDSPDLDGELRGPLLSAGKAALGRLVERLEQLAGVATVLSYDLEIGAQRATEHIHRRLSELGG